MRSSVLYKFGADPGKVTPAQLNPVEAVWSHLKRSLANLTKHNIGQLTALVKTRLRQTQYRPALLDGFLAKTGLDLGLSEDSIRRDLRELAAEGRCQRVYGGRCPSP